MEGWHVVGLDASSDRNRWKNEITFWVNGEQVTVTNPQPSVTLLDWLREQRGLLGTHEGCGEGGCGICTVALVLPSCETVPINSCLRRLCSIDGCHIVNTQGLGNAQTGLHALQTSIADGNGSQCGFCTPGWVMNMYALLQNNPKPAREEIERSFDGNLCRCTGYRPILDAFGDFAKGGACCGKSASVPQPVNMSRHKLGPLHFVDCATGQEWYRPISPTDLHVAQQASLESKKKIRYLCANTASGVVKYLAHEGRDELGTIFIDVSEMQDLKQIQCDSSGLTVGAGVSIANLIEVWENESKSYPAFRSYAEHLKRVASVQIRSVASWAGNVMLCRESNINNTFEYFTSDIVLVLATAGVKVSVSINGRKERLDVLSLVRTKGDVFVESMHIPLSTNSFVHTYKAMQRHVFSHAIVNFGANVTLKPDGVTVDSARVFVGGATSTIVEATACSKALQNAKLNQDALTSACHALKADIDANPSLDPINTLEYRCSLATGFLYKYFMDVLQEQGRLPANFISAVTPFTPADARPVSRGLVDFQVHSNESPLSTWQPKLEAGIQASGELKYSSDIGMGALFAQFVFTTSCNATLTGLDASEALQMPGVRDFVVASDVPGTNNAIGHLDKGGVWGPSAPSLGGSWKIFFEKGDTIGCVGLPVGLIIAENWAQARAAAKKVKQTYSNSCAPIIEREQSEKQSCVVDQGHVQKQLEKSHLTRVRLTPKAARSAQSRQEASLEVQGKFCTGGQAHFFMETNSAVVVPIDGNCFEVYNGGQDPDFNQKAICLALGSPAHSVTIKNPRVGGGFGGKIYYQTIFSTATAVAAHKLRRPIRLQNERSDDMQMMGGRHPIEFDYKATFDNSGKVDSLTVNGLAEDGWIAAPMTGMGAAAASQVENNYDWTSFHPSGKDFLTNTPSNTAMRAPPSMQAALAGDVILEHVAKVAGIDFDKAMELNGILKSTEEFQKIHGSYVNYTVPLLWTQIQQDSNYAARKVAVDQYNASNKWTKKGIAITTSKWDANPGWAYKMGAHVSVYDDGTVFIASGGIEIGQGLNTKLAMAAAQALGIPLEKIQVGLGDTQMLPNSATTGGSCTSENCVEAILEACKDINDRLKPFFDEGLSFQAAAFKAKNQVPAVSLMASVFNTGKWDKRGVGLTTPPYYVYGACVSEALVDMLTGDVSLERVDLVMDLGFQLNAAVDVGQVQGGFVMALGYLLSEEQQVGPDGKQLHLGSWEYKIPTAYDIPVEFNVSLLKDTPNPNGVKSSKAVAEPAMHLVSSPYFAVKNAIYAAREEVGYSDEWFSLNTPITPQVIQQAINVPINRMVVPSS